eukprot:917864-Pleurochrysis_carterae.AAC.2
MDLKDNKARGGMQCCIGRHTCLRAAVDAVCALQANFDSAPVAQYIDMGLAHHWAAYFVLMPNPVLQQQHLYARWL